MKLKTLGKVGIVALAVTAANAQSEEAATTTDRATIIEAALANGDVAAGEKVFKKCKACHMVGEGAKDRTGPVLSDVVGNVIGHSAEFKYSNGIVDMNAAGDIWTLESLDAFLTKPKDFVAKTKMSFAGLKDADDRANVIAYLASFVTVDAPAE